MAIGDWQTNLMQLGEALVEVLEAETSKWATAAVVVVADSVEVWWRVTSDNADRNGYQRPATRKISDAVAECRDLVEAGEWRFLVDNATGAWEIHTGLVAETGPGR